MIRLNGHLTAETPIAVSYVDMNSELPRTPHGEVLLFGGTFRGPLRKAAYKAVRHALAEKRGIEECNVFTLEQAYMLGEGVDTTRAIESESKDGTSDPAAEKQLRRLNPLMNLFGRWRLPSRLSVDGLRAPQKSVMTVGKGVRQDMFQRDNEEITFLSDADAERLASMFASARATQEEIDQINKEVKRLKREITQVEDRSERQALSDQIKAHQERIKTLKQSREGAEESILHPIPGFEAIAPGTELSHRMTLTNGTDADLGLIIHALVAMGREPYIGGHRSIGCGQFSAEWTVSEWPVGKLEAEDIGSIRIAESGVAVKGERLKTAAAQFAEQIDAFDFTLFTLQQARERLDAKEA